MNQHTHKSESPGGTGQVANLKTDAASVLTAENLGKQLATLKAKFERAGHLVHDGGNDDYIVVKADWCMSRHCPDYAALVSFGRMLGVA